MYLTNVRIDILKEVMMFSKFCHKPTPNAWKYVRQVLGYLKNHPDFCLRLGADGLHVSAWSDSSLANHPDAKSHGSHAITIGSTEKPNGGVIKYDTRVIPERVLSIAEAELKKCTDGARDAILLSRLLMNVQLTSTHHFVLYCDNKAAICLARLGEGMTTNSRHFNIKFHFLKDLIDQKIMDAVYVISKSNIVDYGTKNFIGKEFIRQTVRIMFQEDSVEFNNARVATNKRVSAQKPK